MAIHYLKSLPKKKERNTDTERTKNNHHKLAQRTNSEGAEIAKLPTTAKYDVHSSLHASQMMALNSARVATCKLGRGRTFPAALK
jgi:hypothetical protein